MATVCKVHNLIIGRVTCRRVYLLMWRYDISNSSDMASSHCHLQTPKIPGLVLANGSYA